MLPKPLPADCHADIYMSTPRKNIKTKTLQMTKGYALRLLSHYLPPEEIEALDRGWGQARIRFPVVAKAYVSKEGHLIIALEPAFRGTLMLVKPPGRSHMAMSVSRLLRGLDLSPFRTRSHYLDFEGEKAYIIFPRIPREMEPFRSIMEKRKWFPEVGE